MDVAQEVVARIPALADYKAAQGDTRLLETLERSDFQITGNANFANSYLMFSSIRGVLANHDEKMTCQMRQMNGW